MLSGRDHRDKTEPTDRPRRLRKPACESLRWLCRVGFGNGLWFPERAALMAKRKGNRMPPTNPGKKVVVKKAPPKQAANKPIENPTEKSIEEPGGKPRPWYMSTTLKPPQWFSVESQWRLEDVGRVWYGSEQSCPQPGLLGLCGHLGL